MHHFQRSLIIFLSVIFIPSIHSWSEEPVQFAIAIHGGAGGNPDKWTAEEKQLRLDGLKEALQHGRDRLSKGDSALDVVESVVRILEDNPVFNAGRGCVLTAAGEHELDASIMDGATRACGAVAGVRTVKNPISLARLVMTKTPHVLLSGDGAEAFAEAQGVERANADYFRTEKQLESWRKWKERDDQEKKSTSMITNPEDPLFYLGTVGCVALDQKGNLAAATSTGGMLAKRWGRVGDSPIVGAGTIADNRTCAVSCTGVGEQFIRNSIAHDVSARILYAKQDLQQATKAAIHDVLPSDTGGLISVDRHGNLSLPFNTPGMSRGAADSKGRFEVALGKE
jgi:beta-aspartyl-peptidase (threonine type)